MFIWTNQWDSLKNGRNRWCVNIRNQYMDLSKFLDNGILSSIMSFGFKENNVDQYIYLKVNGSKFIFLILYVDDILLATKDLSLLSETKRFLSNNFEIKDIGETYYMIGKEIFRDRSQRLFGLSQKTYIKKVLERFRMDKFSTSPILIQKGGKFSLNVQRMILSRNLEGRCPLCIYCWEFDVCSNLFEARY